MTLFSCAGSQPADIGVDEGRLAPCPSSPNCVSSDAQPGLHQTKPLRFDGDSATAWKFAEAAVGQLPRTRVIRLEPDYLHAECRSALMGFVDDLELYLRADEGTIAVRSASRLGWSDMGVNRRRVDAVRRAFRRAQQTP